MDFTKLSPNMARLTEEELAAHLNDSLRNAVHHYGFIYQPHGYVCMGRCPFCRDHSLDQRTQRKRRKMEFERFIPEEVSCV